MRLATFSFALVAVLAVHAPALADDGPIATAAPSPAPSVAEQIDAYLKTSPALETDDAGAVAGVVSRRDRQVHGEVAVGFGTGGYRDIYARADMPVGESSWVSIAVQETRGRFGPGYRRFGSRALDIQRCDLERLTPPRPLDIMGGPRGECLSPAPLR